MKDRDILCIAHLSKGNEEALPVLIGSSVPSDMLNTELIEIPSVGLNRFVCNNFRTIGLTFRVIFFNFKKSIRSTGIGNGNHFLSGSGHRLRGVPLGEQVAGPGV
jgi:hypothetical protein